MTAKSKQSSRVRKVILFACLFMALFIIIAVSFSPYGSHAGFSYKVMKHTVGINAPAERAYAFLGNSGNASRWSSFVNHITVLNADSFPDGSAGSRRRCFRSKNEEGMIWDELITESVPNTKRHLTIYNLQGFPVTAQHLATEQLYENLSADKCRLTFTLFVSDVKPGMWETLKVCIAAYKIKPIFEKNLSNIKKMLESEQQ